MCLYSSGYGSQTATKSWWPLYTTYEAANTGQHYGRWTEICEVEHRRWLAKIEDGAQPLSSTEWRDRLRGYKEGRKLKDATQAFSEAFLEAYHEGGL